MSEINIKIEKEGAARGSVGWLHDQLGESRETRVEFNNDSGIPTAWLYNKTGKRQFIMERSREMYGEVIDFYDHVMRFGEDRVFLGAWLSDAAFREVAEIVVKIRDEFTAWLEEEPENTRPFKLVREEAENQ